MKYLGKYTVWDFEVAATGNYIHAGVVSHNSGKTLSVAMEVASRILGVPITGADDQVIPLRYRACSKNDPGLYWVIGFNIDHIGQTIYHRLFSPGLGCNYRIIYDQELKRWRAYNQADPKDTARRKESQLSPPLIPPRMIDQESWHMESSAGNIFKSVKLYNGVTICAYASTGDHAKQGDAVDGIWIDEDIENASFLKEWQDRLITNNGWLMWSVWPHVSNFALVECFDRAKAEEGAEKPKIKVFTLIGSENQYSSKEGIEAGLARMSDEDDLAHRDRGDIEGLLGSIAMYNFATALHLARPRQFEPGQKPDNGHELICSLIQRYGKLPDEWTRYLAIDPSHTRTACLFAVVPPPEWEGISIGDKLILEGELVLQRHTPRPFAEALAKRVSGLKFEAFIMDQQIGRMTTVGSDVTVFESYSREFAKLGILSRQTKSGFLRGCNDKQFRRRQVRLMLEPTQDGYGKLVLIERGTHALQKEFHTYRKKQLPASTSGDGKPVVIDEPVNERSHDCMACHDDQTEVLSARGWLPFSVLSSSDLLATVNLGSNLIEYQSPTAHHSSEYAGEMVRFGGMKMDGMVTPNHRMVVFKRPRKAVYEELEPQIVLADDLGPYDCLKLTAGWRGQDRDGPFLVERVRNAMGLEKEIDPGLFAEFLGWYVAEGSIESRPVCPGNGYRINIAQKKDAGIALLKPLLDQLPWKWTRHKGGFSCSSKQLWTHLQGTGDCYTKRVPDWVRWSNQEIIRRFMVGAIAGDGNIQFGKRNYYTSSPLLSGDIQELFLKLGVSASIHVREPKPGGTIRGRLIHSAVPNYRVLEKVRPVAYLADRQNRPNFRREGYEGRVYCASVPNGTLITRRNGRTMVSGNSLEYLVAEIAQRFEMGCAYRSPELSGGRGSLAYQAAQKILHKQDEQEIGAYVHLGPGAAA